MLYRRGFVLAACVKYDPLCIGLHQGVKLGMCMHTLSFVILFQHLVQSLVP